MAAAAPAVAPTTSRRRRPRPTPALRDTAALSRGPRRRLPERREHADTCRTRSWPRWPPPPRRRCRRPPPPRPASKPYFAAGRPRTPCPGSSARSGALARCSAKRRGEAGAAWRGRDAGQSTGRRRACRSLRVRHVRTEAGLLLPVQCSPAKSHCPFHTRHRHVAQSSSYRGREAHVAGGSLLCARPRFWPTQTGGADRRARVAPKRRSAVRAAPRAGG